MIEGNVYYYVVTFFTILVLVLVLIAMVITVSLREYRRKNKEVKWLALIDSKITTAVLEYIEEMQAEESLEFDSLLSSKDFRELLLHRLVQAQKKFSGSAESQILELFKDYGLEKEALQKTYSSKDYKISQGINELRSMNVESALIRMQKLAFHKSETVRHEAQLALIHFKGFDGLEFLSDIQWNISKWHRIRLSFELNDVKLTDESKLINWLQNDQPTVVIFSLVLMRRYQTLSLYNHALALLHHSNYEVQCEVVQTLVFLENETTVSTLIQEFPTVDPQVQQTILSEMATLNDVLVIQFLKEQFTSNSNTKLQLQAAKSLMALGEKEFLIGFTQEVSPESIEKKIAYHALDLAL
ncbi:HEAT repeat domain-containing protein [Chryseobacterium sp. A301]